MRTLKIVTVVMAVMIIAGTTLLVLLIARRMTGPIGHATAAHATNALAEPAGSHITGIATAGKGMLAIAVTGGGPDRVLILDSRSGQVLDRLQLAPPLDPAPKLP